MILKEIPKQPRIVVFQGGPKNGETMPYTTYYPDIKVALPPVFNIGKWYTNGNPLPFEDIQWVHYELKKAARQIFVPYKKWEINPASFKDRYTVKVYEDHHIEMAYVYQFEGNTDSPVVPEEAWFGRQTKTELLDCFQSNNDEAYVDWLQAEEVRKMYL